MKVSIGTLDVDDDALKAIHRENGHRGGKASRNEAKAYVLAAVEAALNTAGPKDALSAPPAADELPEPPTGVI